MYIFWQDKKGRGEIDGHRITQKPALSFEFEYLMVKDDYSEYTPRDAANYPDIEISRNEMEQHYVNRPLSDDHKTDVDRFYSEWSPPAPVPGPTLEQLKATATQKLNAKINAKLAYVVRQYPEREAHTWPTSMEESRALLLDSGADAPLVRAAATESGIPPADLAGIIVANGNAFAQASGQIVGLRIKVKNLIDAAATVEEVDAAMDLLA